MFTAGYVLRSTFCPRSVFMCFVWNRVLRKIFGPRRDEVTGEWRKMHKEELNDLYPSPNIVRVIKSRRMRWAGHVARMGEERGCTGSWWGNRREGTTGET